MWSYGYCCQAVRCCAVFFAASAVKTLEVVRCFSRLLLSRRSSCAVFLRLLLSSCSLFCGVSYCYPVETLAVILSFMSLSFNRFKRFLLYLTSRLLCVLTRLFVCILRRLFCLQNLFFLFLLPSGSFYTLHQEKQINYIRIKVELKVNVHGCYFKT